MVELPVSFQGTACVMTLRGTFGQQFVDSVKVVCDVMFGDLIDGG